MTGTGETDAMSVQRHDIRRPEAAGGGFEERFWSPVNSPVHGPSGQLAWIIHRVEDVVSPAAAAGGHTVVVTASVGTARSYAGSDSADVLLRDAGLAMAKSHGGDRCQVFDEQLRVSALARLTTEQGLRTDLAGNQFRLHYQPEVRLTDGGVSGFEALIRWHHLSASATPRWRACGISRLRCSSSTSR